MRVTQLWDAPGDSVSPLHDEDEELHRLRSVQLYLELRARGHDPGSPLSTAWKQFYQAEAPRLLRLARVYSPPGTDPRDGAQLIWQAIVTRLPDFRFDPERGSIHAWLMTLARHVLIDQRRHEHSHPATSLNPEEATHLPSPDPGPARVCELHQAQGLVRGALAELRSQVSETSYQVVHQHWIEDRSFAAIAHELGLTPKQVRDRHDRMLRKLRTILMGHAAGRSWEE
jgi:RNA polymerase sigma-70 factor (ECF subfamily)